MKSVITTIFFTLLLVSAAAQRSVPPHDGKWVHDDADILSPQAEAQLEAILKAHRDSTSTQIAVLLIPSLDGDDIDSYSLRVAEAWKLGQEKKDNGILFLVAMQEKQMRIEVGQGLEGELTDALSSRINRNEVAPNFRQGNYEAGIVAGVMGIIHSVEGTYVNDEPVVKKRKGRSPIGTIIFVVILLIAMSRKNRGGGGGSGGYWTAAMMGSMLGGSMGRSSGSWGSGSDFGGGGGFGGGGSSDSW
ncbi:MAG: hypothetical protein RI909_2294 [Bacteroidota bacterium]|jgi:uncharacterized protein